MRNEEQKFRFGAYFALQGSFLKEPTFVGDCRKTSAVKVKDVPKLNF